MQVVVTTNQKKKVSKFIQCFAEHKYYLILFSFLLTGMLIGAILVQFINEPFSNAVNEWVMSFLDIRMTGSYGKLFFSCYLSAFLCVVVICLSAFGIIGLPLMPVMVFVRGLGTCLLAGVLYSEFSLQGIMYANLVLLPFCIIFDFMLLYLSSASMELSRQFLSVLLIGSDKLKTLKTKGIKLLRRAVSVCVVLIPTSLLDATFNVLLIKYIDF